MKPGIELEWGNGKDEKLGIEEEEEEGGDEKVEPSI